MSATFAFSHPSNLNVTHPFNPMTRGPSARETRGAECLRGRYRIRTCDLCGVNAKRKPPVTTGPRQVARDSWLLGAYRRRSLRDLSGPHVAAMWSRLSSDRYFVTVEHKASLLNNDLTINAGELKLELLMGRWTGGGPLIQRVAYV